MKFKGLGVQVDGVFLLVVIAVVGAIYFRFKRDEISNSVNVTHEDNVVNQAVISAVGKKPVQGFFDRVFAAADILTPWNGVSDHAKNIWGIDTRPKGQVSPAFGFNDVGGGFGI